MRVEEVSNPKCGSQWNPFISSPCQSESAPRKCSGPSPIPDLQKRSDWEILLIYLMMTPPSAVTSLILQTGRLQPLSSLQTLTKSQTGQTLGTCLSIQTNRTLSLSLSPKAPSGKPLHLLSQQPSRLSKRFSHSNSWVSL